MVINFSNAKLDENPTLILRNLDGTAIGVLGSAFNIQLSARYNEVSELTFDLPEYVDGARTPFFDKVAGMRIVDVKGYGQFMLVSPKTSSDGVRSVKSCQGYSLEFELTFPHVSLDLTPVPLWSLDAPQESLLYIITKEYAPSWSIGKVDTSLLEKFRKIEVDDDNVYNFLKSMQETYNCVFHFDTYERTIHVRDLAVEPETMPVYLSHDNLIKDLDVEEDTENIFTVLSVYGEDDVNIRTVNPLGSNKIINLDYFMNTDHFPQAIIDKWNGWKALYSANQAEFFNTAMEQAMLQARILSEEAQAKALEDEVEKLRVVLSTYVDFEASGEADMTEQMAEVNGQIEEKEAELAAQEALVAELNEELEQISPRLQQIVIDTSLEATFTEEELLVLRRYFKEDSIQDSAFVSASVKSYSGSSTLSEFSGAVEVNNASITQVKLTDTERALYTIKAGTLETDGLKIGNIKATLQREADGSIILSAYLGSGEMGEEEIVGGSLVLTGQGDIVDADIEDDDETPTAIGIGTRLTLSVAKGSLYYTEQMSEFDQRMVEWDLFDYGWECLRKLAYPTYTFSLTSGNFLAAEEFVQFRRSLVIGDKLYVRLSDDRVLEPILLNVDIDFENLDALSLKFGDKYSASDSRFYLADLLDQSISMGKSLDLNKNAYSAFLDSGAATAIKEFMDGSLDVAKNAVLSSGDQAIIWDEAGLRLCKKDAGGGYQREQIWMINNNIVFTDDNWYSAKMAIGTFKDTALGTVMGVCAPAVVGTLLAGNSLRIESQKQDGLGNAVFTVDSTGASLHNATFDIVSGVAGKRGHISLNPDIGLAIGTYPLYGSDGNLNERNAQFYADTEGNVTFKGHLSGASGEFTGVVKATDYQDKDGNSLMSSGTFKFNSKYLDLMGLKITDPATNQVTFEVSSTGNITMSGNINSANITGGVITGTHIQTAGPADRGYEIYSSATTLNSNTMVGGIKYDNNGAGTGEEARNRLWIYTRNDYALKFQSATGISLEPGANGQVHIRNPQLYGDLSDLAEKLAPYLASYFSGPMRLEDGDGI